MACLALEDLEFREGTAEDVEGAMEVIRQRIQWMEQKGLRQWNDGTYLQVYNRDFFLERAFAGELWVAVRGGAVMAVCTFFERDSRWVDDRSACYVHNFAAALECPGLGRRFLEFLASLAARRGKRALRLDCGVDNEILKSYYRAAGFEPRGEFEVHGYRGCRQERLLRRADRGRQGYDTILLDADDTLLDFQANERESLTALFRELRCPLTEEIRGLYSRLNRELWGKFERGEIDRQTVLDSRFALLFQELGKEADGPELERRYRAHLNRGAQVLPGALVLCRRLSGKKRLCIVTNGVAETQRRRLKDSGIAAIVPEIFVSEEAGFQKPDRRFFDWIFNKIGAVDSQRVLIVGDSLSSDIQGGCNAGIDSCWFNPSGKPFRHAVRPTWEIRRLEELDEIVDPPGMEGYVLV